MNDFSTLGPSLYSSYDAYLTSTKKAWLEILDDGQIKLNPFYKYYEGYSYYIKSFYSIDEYESMEVWKNKDYLI